MFTDSWGFELLSFVEDLEIGRKLFFFIYFEKDVERLQFYWG